MDGHVTFARPFPKKPDASSASVFDAAKLMPSSSAERNANPAYDVIQSASWHSAQ